MFNMKINNRYIKIIQIKILQTQTKIKYIKIMIILMKRYNGSKNIIKTSNKIVIYLKIILLYKFCIITTILCKT